MSDNRVKARVLVVEDDPMVSKTIRMTCETEGYEIHVVERGGDALPEVESFKPDLVILDIQLPDMLGFDVCRGLREAGHAMPVIILSAQNDEIDVVLGLEIGANDYVHKPFRSRELLARIAAQLRQSTPAKVAPPAGNELRFGDLTILVGERQVTRADVAIDLTHTEFDVLLYLASSAGHVLSHEDIFRSVWGTSDSGQSRVLPVHIGNLRKKIEPDAAHPKFILTVPGIGYRFAQIPPS